MRARGPDAVGADAEGEAERGGPGVGSSEEMRWRWEEWVDEVGESGRASLFERLRTGSLILLELLAGMGAAGR